MLGGEMCGVDSQRSDMFWRPKPTEPTAEGPKTLAWHRAQELRSRRSTGA